MKLNLVQLEGRLQALIEGGAARLFPVRGGQKDLSRLVTDALRDGIQAGENGELVAPNLYTLVVNPAQVEALQANVALLDSLTQALRQAGDECRVRFAGPLAIRVEGSARLSAGDVQVLARDSQAGLPGTTSVASEPAAPTAIPPNAYLIVNGTQLCPLTQAVINIGRRLDNQLVIDDPRVSRLHAQLRAVEGHYLIFDLDSTGGTAVNGQPVRQYSLSAGDVISLAGIPLVYGQDTSPQVTPTQNLGEA